MAVLTSTCNQCFRPNIRKKRTIARDRGGLAKLCELGVSGQVKKYSLYCNSGPTFSLPGGVKNGGWIMEMFRAQNPL